MINSYCYCHINDSYCYINSILQKFNITKAQFLLKMQVNRSSQQHYDARKQSLIQQILSYRRRIEQYEKLQEQLNSITKTINFSESGGGMKQSNNLSKSNSSSLLRNNQKSNTLQPSNSRKQLSQRRASSSKKIKIYELQKKLLRLNKQHNQKFSQFISTKRQNQVILETSRQISRYILKEQELTLQVEQMQKELIGQIQQQNGQLVKSKQQLKKESGRKEMYEFQKESVLGKIRDTRQKMLLLKGSSQNVMLGVSELAGWQQFNGSLAIDIAQQNGNLSSRQTERTMQEGQQGHLTQGDLSDLSYSKITQTQKEQRKLVHDGVQYEILDHNHSLQCSYHSNYNSIQNNQTCNAQKQTKDGKLHPEMQNTVKDLAQMFQILKDKVQIMHSQNTKLNTDLFQINKQMIAIQTQIKHHKTNTHLLKHKISAQGRFIQRQKTSHFYKLQQLQKLRAKLNLKQTQTGEIRGRLGTRVEQQALLKMVNVTIQKDLQSLKQKVNSLIIYRTCLLGTQSYEIQQQMTQ